MNKKSTTDTSIKELKETVSPKDSTITFLMNFARVYSCNNSTITKAEGYILN